MKKFSLFLTVIFLISVGSSFQQVAAQEKSKADQDKEQKIQQEIDQQKKAMADQIKNFRVEVESRDKDGENIMRYLPRGNRSFVFDEPFNFSGPDMQGFYGHLMSGDSERTTLDFSKSVKDNTFSREY